jgi:hypothetical protein
MPEPTYQELVDLVASQAELIEKLTDYVPLVGDLVTDLESLRKTMDVGV